MAKPDRPLTLHGPAVRWVLISSALTNVCAIAALILSLTLYADKLDRNSQRLGDIQTSRRDASLDTCYLLRSLVTTAYGQRYYVAGQRLLSREGLQDCVRYANQRTTIGH